MGAATARAVAAVSASAWSSARGWWRRTAATSGPRAWARAGGTRFTFTVPVAEEAAIGAAAGARRGSRAPRKTRARTPILVVDDDPQMLRYVRDALAAGGYAPLLTGNPEELPGLVRTHRPRLVLLDLRLPGTDGIELMERIPELGDLPVIFISAYGSDETIVRALDAGAADYIVKPFSPTELTARVRGPCAGGRRPSPSCWGSWPSATTSAGSPWPAVPWS